MSEVLQTHPPAQSASNSKPPTPPPTEEQMERVRDLASQLYYGFKKRPQVCGDGRDSWEARFMRKFHAMLKILVVAKFDELPPFAIGCIWENNRRLRAKEPKFDPERVVSANSPGHPAYRRYAEGRLRYTPAFEGSPMSLKREGDIRDNWWRKSRLVGRRDETSAPDAVEGMQEGDVVGEVGIDGEPENSVKKKNDGATEEGESEVEEEVEDADTGPSTGTRGRRGRRRKAMVSPAAPPVGGIPTGRKQNKSKGKGKAPQRAAAEVESEMDVDVEEGERGRPASKAKSSPALTQGAGARTHSASRIRAAAAKSVVNAESGPSRGSVKSRSHNAKGKEPAAAKLTLFDLQPERVVSQFIEHPRPCDRCRKLNIACMFNPLSRSYCEPCRDKKARCSNAFKLTTDHGMATYLGYAFFRMASDPSTYVEPTFTPMNLPNPLPTNIEWFRALYNEAKTGGKVKAKKSVAPSLIVASSADKEAADDAPAPPAVGELPRESSHRSRQSTPLTTCSRSVSLAPSGASSTMLGSSAVSAEQPPLSPSAMSETSHAVPPEVAAMSVGGLSRTDNFGPPDAMSIDEEEGLGVSTAASDGLSSDGGGEGTGPRLRSGTSDAAETVHSLTVRGTELEMPSTSREELSAFPPPPHGAARPATSIHLVPRLHVTDSWKSLPSVGPRMRDGYYSVVRTPHNEDWIARWQELANTGKRNVSEAWNAHDHLNSHKGPPSRPQWPPSSIFSVSDEVQRIVQATRETFNEIALIKERMQTGATLHNRQSQDVLGRRPSNDHPPGSGNDEGSLIRLEDLSSIFVALGEVYSVLTQFSAAFQCIPAVPVNWTALSDLLTQLEHLRDLYRVSWEHFASLEEDVRPLRAEMQCVRYGVAHVQEQLDGISNDTVSACEPLIHNLYQQIDTRLSRLEQGGGPSLPPLPPQVSDVVKMLTRLSERVEQLERAAEADDFHIRIDGYISRYLVERGLHDHVLRQLGGTGETAALSSASGGSSISHALQGVHAPAPPSEVFFPNGVPDSTLSTNSPFLTLHPTRSAISNAGRRAHLEPPLDPPLDLVATAAGTSTPSTASPSTETSVPPSAAVPQPAHRLNEETGTRCAISAPHRGSVVSKMYSSRRGAGTTTGRRGV